MAAEARPARTGLLSGLFPLFEISSAAWSPRHQLLLGTEKYRLDGRCQKVISPKPPFGRFLAYRRFGVSVRWNSPGISGRPIPMGDLLNAD